jgi:hypothetical protein
LWGVRATADPFGELSDVPVDRHRVVPLKDPDELIGSARVEIGDVTAARLVERSNKPAGWDPPERANPGSRSRWSRYQPGW